MNVMGMENRGGLEAAGIRRCDQQGGVISDEASGVSGWTPTICKCATLTLLQVAVACNWT